MPLLAVLIGGLCGLAVWLLVDRFQTAAIRDVFQEDLGRRLDRWAVANLIAFDSYVDSYTSVTRLLASHRRMASYLDLVSWDAQGPITPRVYRGQSPPWLPLTERWRHLVQPSHLLLIDTSGRVREVYQLGEQPLPGSLRHVDSLLLSESLLGAFLTTFDDKPYLVASDNVEDNAGTVQGALTMVVPIDDAFLKATQRGYASSETVTAVLSEDLQRVLASSDPQSLPVGTPMERARQNFVVTTQSFFDYEGSYLNMQYGIFVPEARVAEMSGRVLSLERRQRIILAAVLVAVFTLVIMLVSEHISRVLRRIARFSQRALGFGETASLHGNQLILLEDWIRDFIRLVLAARDEMRARHESQIRESEAVKSSILETSLDSIVTIDSSGSIIELNPTAERIFGYPRNDVIGRDMAELLIEQPSRHQFQMLLESCLLIKGRGDGADVRSEMVAVSRDGSDFSVEVAMKSVLLQAQRVCTVYLHDISKRKQAEQEIQGLAKFTSESPSPVLRVNRRGVLLYANAASEPLLAYWGIRHGQTMPIYWKNLIVASLQDPRNAEHEVVTDGRIFSLLLAPVGGLDYVNIYGRDITEVRMAEQQTRQHQADLVHVCRLSTMGEMATGLAHELNQPLSAILNFSSGCARRLRLGTGGRDELLEALNQISIQADRAGEIIRRLRNLVGKQPPIRSFVAVNRVVREVCSFVEFEARKMGLACEEEFAGEDLIIRADLVQIEQVLLNLIRNALDALREIPEERRRLVVRTRRKGSDKVMIMVEDNGPGIDETVRRRLFDPFFSTKESGMGMGLAISQTIVAGHQGQILVSSRPGAGTVFTLILPLAEFAEQPDDEAEESMHA